MSNMLSKVQALQQLERQATSIKDAILFQEEQEEGECIQVSPGCYEGGVEGWSKTGDVSIVKTKDKDSWPEEFASFEHPDDAEHYVALRNAAPGILAVLSQFRDGDADKLSHALKCDETLDAHEFVSVLQRMQAACALMEASQE